MSKIITRRSRGIGWGFTLHPNDPPIEPSIVGTIKQVFESRDKDIMFDIYKKTLKCNERWFIDGEPIRSINGFKETFSFDLLMLSSGQKNRLIVEVGNID